MISTCGRLELSYFISQVTQAGALRMCMYECACLYVKVCTSVYTIYVQQQFSNPPNRQDSDKFPLNVDELLMPTFCFLLMEKSFENGFFFSSGAPNEFVSCLSCQYYFQTLLWQREALIRILDVMTLLL